MLRDFQQTKKKKKIKAQHTKYAFLEGSRPMYGCQRLNKLRCFLFAVMQTGKTALHLAAKEGCLESVVFLLKKGAMVNVQDDVTNRSNEK